jgi:subtilase family serine protease
MHDLQTDFSRRLSLVSVPPIPFQCSVIFKSSSETVRIFKFGDPHSPSYDRNDRTEWNANTIITSSFTSLGATTSIHPEKGANFSSGGFSNYFPRPTYQDQAVSSYLSQIGTKYDGLYNKTGRGIPDIATQGDNFVINYQGNFTYIFGTSASGPVFASMVALLNDRLIKLDKPPLGFLNPLLYSERGRKALIDIIEGNNPGCNTTGFDALEGWDPVSGV